MKRIGGIVLAGGQSKRMGVPKATLLFGGETLLARAVRILRSVVSPVVVSAAGGQELPELCVPVVRDSLTNCGPLIGLLTGMKHLEYDCDAAFALACDMPGMTEEFVKTLIAKWDGEAAAVVPRVKGQTHPLAALYRTATVIDFAGRYETLRVPPNPQETGLTSAACGDTCKASYRPTGPEYAPSMHDFLSELHVHYVEDLPAECIINVNTLREWQAFCE